MLNKKKYSKQPIELPEEINKMISGTYISWEKSKEEIWTELERKIFEASPIVPVRIVFRPWIRVAVAAMITVLLGLTVFMQVHIKTIQIPPGQHSDIILPDQSDVQLNAQSVLSYKPLLWHFSRRVKLEGEAYFKVKDGKKFEVISGKCKTIVLGTDFNIYARDDEYKVTCVSGTVKVIEMVHHNEVLLQTGQQAELSADHVLEVKSDINTEQTLSWLSKKLSFTSSPIDKVFEEIGRQYGVFIYLSDDIDFTYTGNFNRNISIEKVLELVCKPFDLKFTRKSKDEYLISKNK